MAKWRIKCDAAVSLTVAAGGFTECVQIMLHNLTSADQINCVDAYGR